MKLAVAAAVASVGHAMFLTCIDSKAPFYCCLTSELLGRSLDRERSLAGAFGLALLAAVNPEDASGTWFPLLTNLDGGPSQEVSRCLNALSVQTGDEVIVVFRQGRAPALEQPLNVLLEIAAVLRCKVLLCEP